MVFTPIDSISGDAMRSEQVVKKVSEHLDAGRRVRLSLEAGGRFVKLVRWRLFGSKYEISGATEVTIRRLIAVNRLERRKIQPATRGRGPGPGGAAGGTAGG